MSPSTSRAAILGALHEVSAPAAAGGYRTVVVSRNDDFDSATYLIYPAAGIGEHRYVPKYGYATARVLADILAKRANAAAH